MNCNSVLPIIVLFHPNLILLGKLIDSLVEQVGLVCFVDNTPQSVKADVTKLCELKNIKFKYVELNQNKGIAYAQNCGIHFAMDQKYAHVLLLDQDSVLPANLIDDLCEAEASLLNKGVLVAAVGPAFRDEKTGKLAPAIQQNSLFVKRLKITDGSRDPIRCDYIIASGTLIRTSVLKKFGLMLDDLFIDWVDIEWGERCRFHGYYVFMIPNIVMKHSIGDEHVSITGRDINLHSDFRNYFIVRNAIHLQKIKTVRCKLKFSLALRVPLYVLFFSYHSKRKLYSLFLLLRAIIDGFAGNMGKGYFKC